MAKGAQGGTDELKRDRRDQGLPGLGRYDGCDSDSLLIEQWLRVLKVPCLAGTVIHSRQASIPARVL
jgi:hypothetical protein